MLHRVVTICAAMLGLACSPAMAQLSLDGQWTALFHEDQPERIPGPDLVDYVGLPINEAARAWALAWDPSRLTLTEHQCQVHTAAYIFRGPLQLRIWEDRNPETQELVAIKQYISNYEQARTIWMDGRPHPPDYAPHTWMGFSTGKWEGDILTIATTHIKQGWHRRNGLPSSDQITLTEHFIRHDNYLTHVSIVNDPVYLAEPLVKSEDFLLSVALIPQERWLYPCEYVVEIPDRPRDAVPSYLPGENPFLLEFSKKRGIPQEAALGGPATMYPEFKKQLQK